MVEDRLASLQQRMLEILARRRTFAYAMYLTILLDRKVGRDEVEIEVAGEPPRIHRVWGSLAERGVGLLCEPEIYGRADEIVKVVESSSENLVRKDGSKVVEDLEDYIKSERRDRRSAISEIISSYIKPYAGTQGLYRSLVNYFVDHLETLGRLRKISANGLENYIKTVFCNRVFLEYEVYSRLVDNRIPAFPKL